MRYVHVWECVHVCTFVHVYYAQGTCTYIALISRLSPSSVHYCVTFDPPSATHVLIWQEPWFICKHVSPFTYRSYVCMYYIYMCVPSSTHDACFLSIESGGMWLRTPAAQDVGPSLFKGSLTITDTPRDTFIDMRVHVYNTL